MDARLEGPTLARSSLRSWQAGGRQEFAADAIAQRYLTLKAEIARARQGLQLTKRRRPQGDVTRALVCAGR